MQRRKDLLGVPARGDSLRFADCEQLYARIREVFESARTSSGARNNKDDAILHQVSACTRHKESLGLERIHLRRGCGDENIHRSALLNLALQRTRSRRIQVQCDILMALLINQSNGLKSVTQADRRRN